MQWKTSDAPAQFIAALIRGIVGVRFIVSRVDAKAKMGQNRDTRDALGVADGLVARGQGADRAVSAMMRSARN
jgi:transcriptional regulator